VEGDSWACTVARRRGVAEGSESDGGTHMWRRHFMSADSERREESDEVRVKAVKESTHAGTFRIER
jgi:hypothetical protein